MDLVCDRSTAAREMPLPEGPCLRRLAWCRLPVGFPIRPRKPTSTRLYTYRSAQGPGAAKNVLPLRSVLGGLPTPHRYPSTQVSRASGLQDELPQDHDGWAGKRIETTVFCRNRASACARGLFFTDQRPSAREALPLPRRRQAPVTICHRHENHASYL
jgi:hypothetical protein